MIDLKLPPPVEEAVGPLFEKLAPNDAMPRLVETSYQPSEFSPLVDDIVHSPGIAEHPPLVAGLWLYVDELDKSHTVSQSIADQTGSYWHGIMHRREGDFSNSHHWFRKAEGHPVIGLMDEAYEPHAFVDEVQAAHQNQAGSEALVDLQRQEWFTLFVWCARQAK